jgi:hypothetical protein
LKRENLLFSKHAVDLVLAFCKCADERWKKAAGKKNKFWDG